MATKNLVPRSNSEGKLGLNSRKWLEVNAVSGSFTSISTNKLLNLDGQDLLDAGDGITITNDTENSRIVIASSGSNTALSDRIFEGDEGSQTSVETINTTDPEENKISFSISGDEKWYIDSNGHMLPTVNNSVNETYNLGSLLFPVNKLYVENEGLIFKNRPGSENSSNLKYDVSDKKLKLGLLDTTNNYVYDILNSSKEDVKAATTENIDLSTALIDGVIIDDVTLSTGDRVLVKDQTSAVENGIYIVSASDAASRSNDFNNGLDFKDLKVTVIEGTDNGQKIFLTVPHTNGDSITGTNDLKWVSIVGGGGLEAVFDDKAPVLGGDLKVGSFDIISESGNSIDLITEAGTASLEAGLTLYSGLGAPNITFKSTLSQPPQLFLETPDKKKIKIAGVSNAFFTGQAITGQQFEYAFKNNLTTTEKNAGTAYFATQGWVASQGYVTTSPDLINYVLNSTASTPSLGSITILNEAVNQQSWGDNNVVTKGYVDSVLQGIDEVLEPVKAATDKNVDLTNNLVNNNTINNGTITLVTGDRILVKNQTTASENGVYIVQAAGAAIRSTDLAANSNANAVFVFVEKGSNASTGFLCTSPSGSDVVGTNDLTFVKMSSATEITVSSTSALTKTGNALSVNVDDSSIKINTDNQLYIKAIPSDAISLTSFTDLDTITDDDRFIITDASSTPDPHVAKKGTASLIKNYIRTDITSATGDVHFSLPVAPETVMSVEAQNALITDKNEVLDGNDPVSLADDDYLLYSDTSDSDNLKKVKYSTIKNNISAASSLDINSLPLISDDDVGLKDELAIYNLDPETGSARNQKITVEKLKNKISAETKLTVSVLTNAATILAQRNYHYVLQAEANNFQAVSTYVLNITNVTDRQKGDVIKVTMYIPTASGHPNFTTKSAQKTNLKVIFGLSGDDFTNFSYEELSKPIEFIYTGSEWKTSYRPRELNRIYRIVGSSTLSAFNNNYFYTLTYPKILVGIQNTTVTINLPDQNFIEANNIMPGFRREIYLGWKDTETVTFNCNDALIFSRRSDPSRIAGKTSLSVPVSGDSVKVVATLMASDGNSGGPIAQSNEAVLGERFWFIESISSDASGDSLPDGTTGQVLQFNANNTLAAGLVSGSNIADDAIVSTHLNSQAVETEAIKNNNVTFLKMQQVHTKKALGSLNDSQSTTQNQPVSEIDILTSLDNAITSEHTKLVTATAIKNYVASQVAQIPVSANSSTLPQDINLTYTSEAESEVILSNIHIENGTNINLNHDASNSTDYLYINGLGYQTSTAERYDNIKNSNYHEIYSVNQFKIYMPSAKDAFLSYGPGVIIEINITTTSNTTSMITSSNLLFLPNPGDPSIGSYGGNINTEATEGSFVQPLPTYKLKNMSYEDDADLDARSYNDLASAQKPLLYAKQNNFCQLTCRKASNGRIDEQISGRYKFQLKYYRDKSIVSYSNYDNSNADPTLDNVYIWHLLERV